MKLKYMIATAIISILVVLSSCNGQMPQSGDTLVPPVSADIASENSKASSCLNNFSNMSPLSQPSSNMTYTILDESSTPVMIFADNKYLYILRSNKGKTVAKEASSPVFERTGNVIEVYDAENGSLVRRIDEKRLGICSSFTVKDSNIYAFDMSTGRVNIFSSTGKYLSAYDTGLSEVYAEKMVITDNMHVVMKIYGCSDMSPEIAVFDIDTSGLNKFNANQLFEPKDGSLPESINFCICKENSIFINNSNGTLGLFNFENGKAEKTCIFSRTAGYMEFDGNVLYYTVDTDLGLGPGNLANFKNVNGRSQTCRLLINDEFTWPDTEEELDVWKLNALPMPHIDVNGRHYGMANNTKYLFFLDFIVTEQEGNNMADQKFMIYRVMK